MLVGLLTVIWASSQLGSHINFFLDEGIYLHGAQRVLAGEHPYTDWFAFTGPGTFWLLASVFKIFRASLAAAHGVLSLEIGVIAGSIYWILSRRLSKLAAAAAVASFLVLLIIFDHRLYVNHRWDSACCLILAAALLIGNQPKPGLICLVGALAGSGIAFTPPAALIVAALWISLLLIQEYRSRFFWFGIGVVLPLTTAVVVLAAQHSLAPMLQGFQWASEHYQQANRVPYGFEPVEPSSLLAEPFWHRALIEVPPALPLLALALLAVTASKRIRIPAPVKLLFAAGAGAVAACYPRWAANQLLFTVPFFLCSIFLLASQLLAARTLRLVSMALLGISGLSIVVVLANQPSTVPVRTELGTVLCTPRDERNVAFVTAATNPGDSLFVYPYQPIWYSITGGVNPTSYDFLQPGMMTLEDESEVLRQLSSHPPQWVIWHNLPPRTVLAFWPHSDPATLRFARLEEFIRSHYSQVRPSDVGFRYAVALFRHIDSNAISSGMVFNGAGR